MPHRCPSRRPGPAPTASLGGLDPPMGRKCQSLRNTVFKACADHPRRRGEQKPAPPFPGVDKGPSLRVRGAGARRPRPCERRGTIPAGAGSSAGRNAGCRWPGDHPRRCGEQLATSAAIAEERGTIPAGAGSSGCRPGSRSVSGDHPCGCGDAEHAVAQLRELAGIIPAGAGSRWPAPGQRGRPWDHPRGCGEQTSSSSSSHSVWGPSPLAGGEQPYVLSFRPPCMGSSMQVPEAHLGTHRQYRLRRCRYTLTIHPNAADGVEGAVERSVAKRPEPGRQNAQSH